MDWRIDGAGSGKNGNVNYACLSGICEYPREEDASR